MFLRLISDQRIHETLKLMGQAPNARLTPAVVLDGSIASLGSQYVRGLRATDCRSGKLAPKPRCAGDGRTRPRTCRRYDNSGEAGGRTRQDRPARHACSEKLASCDPCSDILAAQRNRTSADSERDKTRREPIAPSLSAWRGVSHVPRRQTRRSRVSKVHRSSRHGKERTLGCVRPSRPGALMRCRATPQKPAPHIRTS